jgi:hypothetical protein
MKKAAVSAAFFEVCLAAHVFYLMKILLFNGG